MKSLKQLLWERWGTAEHPAEWDGREAGGRGSQRFWEYLWTINQLGPAGCVLDAGCGKPMFFVNLLAAAGLAVRGVDPDVDGITLEDYVRQDAPKDFDVVTCISVLEHIDDKEAFCDALDTFNAPIVLTFEFGAGCIEIPMAYKCLARFKRHHLSRMDLCPVWADNSAFDKWRPMGVVLDLNL